MKKFIHLGWNCKGGPGVRGETEFTLPLDFVTRTLAIIGIRGSGKTTAATVLAEEMSECGLPWIALDPVGTFWGLRANKEGQPGGYPVFILGGSHGDLPITKNMGHSIAEAILEQNISCVIDLSGESKTTWRHFVTEFCDRLMELKPSIPRHIFIEEAPEFVPQRPLGEQRRSLAAVDRLIRLGRNRGYGATLISQRFATINKDVLTQCENLLALRSIGKPDRKAVEQWIAECVPGSEPVAEPFMKSLTGLEDGTGWFWSPQWLHLNDYEAWAGETLEDAISVAMKECGTSKEETFDDCYGYEIPGDTEIEAEDDGTTNVYTMLAVMEARGEKGLVCVFGDP